MFKFKRFGINRPDKLAIGLVVGGVFPLSIGMVAMVLWFYVSRDERIAPYCLATGFLCGFLTDLVFLKRWMSRCYELPFAFVSGVFIFYNIMIYGFFMGFPVFNLISGPILGWYFGRRMVEVKIPVRELSRMIRKISGFAAIVMIFICGASASIALSDPWMGKSLQMLFRLELEVTKPAIAAISLIGGLFLVVAQYFLTSLVLNWTCLAKRES